MKRINQVVTIGAIITASLIILIYIGDMLSCLLTDSPISTLELALVIALIISTVIAGIYLKKHS